MAYTKGLHDLGHGCHAWLQPDGGWGWSNSGLVVGDGASLMVDTLFDLASTRQMLDGIAPIVAQAPLATVVNTHSDGDHCFGNKLVAGAGVEIIASEAAAALITQDAIAELQALSQLSDGVAGEYATKALAPFRFDDITVVPPTRTFTERLTLEVGGREVELIQVGPAHTAGDVVIHVPDAGTLYAGDILFIESTPIVWVGPPQRWVDACDLLLDMPVDTFVPGHGPVTDKRGVVRVRDYLQFVITEATKRYEQGMSVDDAIASIDLGIYDELPGHGRIAQNVVAQYQALDPARPEGPRIEVFSKIAELEGVAGAGAAQRAR